VKVTAQKRYQLSRFLILMDQFGEAQKATNAAMNSAGSGYAENAKYLESYQARINNMSNSWTEFSLSMEEALLGDSIIVATDLLSFLSRNSASAVDAIGLLPPVFMAVSSAAIMMSKSFRTAVVDTSVLKGAMTGLTITARGAGLALKTMAAATGVGLIFAGIGFGIEKLISHMAKVSEEKRKMDSEIKTLTQSYKDNQSQIDALVKSYDTLSTKRKSGSLSADEEKEYFESQNKLNELLPSLTDNVDKSGQAHLRSSEAIKKEIQQINELANIDSQKFVDGFSKSVDELNKKIDETTDKIDKLKNPDTSSTSGYGGIIGGVPKIDDSVSLDNKARVIMAEREEIALMEQKVQGYKDLADAYANSIGVQDTLIQADQNYIDTLVDKNKKLVESEDGQVKLEEKVKSLVVGIDDLRNAFGESISNQEKFADVSDFINQKFGENSAASNELITWVRALSNEQYNLADATDEETDSQDENTKAIWENITATEMLYGITDEHLKKTEQAITVFETLSEVENLNTQQKEMLADAAIYLAGNIQNQDDNMRNAILTIQTLTGVENLSAAQKYQLSQAYDVVNDAVSDNLKMIKNEVIALNILNDANADSADVMMANQYLTTLNTIRNTENRIEAYKREAIALNQIISVHEQMNGIMPTNIGSRMIGRIGQINVSVKGLTGSLNKAKRELNGFNLETGLPSQQKGSKGGSGGSKGRSGGSGSSRKSDAEKEADDIREAHEDLADDIIDIYKETYEEQRDLQLDAIDDEIDALEKAHDKKIDMLDDEMDKYSDLIKQRLDSIDKQEDTDNYNKELASKQKERQDILNQINVLSMDTSVEGQRRVADLRQELADKELEIEEFKHDREIQLRKDNLNQQLEDKQAQIDAQKEQENAAFEAQKATLEAERVALERHWENLLNDERKWAEIRQQVLNGEFANITKDLTGFASELNKHMGTIGESITQNLIDKINEAKNSMKELKGGSAPGSGGSGSSGGGSQQKRYHTVKRGDTYSELAEQYYGDASKWKKIYDANGIDPKKLQIGSKLLIPYHQGGLVGDKPGGKLPELINRLFNTKPNEQVIKALKGELMIPQQNIMKNFLPNMQSVLSSMQTPNLVGNAGNNVTIDIHNITVTGGKQGANDFFKEINNSLGGRGVKFNL
jgi:LysM repeat protein